MGKEIIPDFHRENRSLFLPHPHCPFLYPSKEMAGEGRRQKHSHSKTAAEGWCIYLYTHSCATTFPPQQDAAQQLHFFSSFSDPPA